jgi:hypothetical protein
MWSSEQSRRDAEIACGREKPDLWPIPIERGLRPFATFNDLKLWTALRRFRGDLSGDFTSLVRVGSAPKIQRHLYRSGAGRSEPKFLRVPSEGESI